jgi:hypothetical protein
MNNHPNRRDHVPASSAHLPAEILEQLAEGSLPPAEASNAATHVQACGRCFAELEGYKTLFTMLERLPRFAPSAAFSDAVMARVQIATQESRLAALLRRLMPTTRRGWALIGFVVTAPATPVLALIAWLITQPLLTPSTLWQFGMIRTQSAVQAAFAWVAERTVGGGFGSWAESSYSMVQSVPLGAVGAAVALLAIAMPVSAWGLIHLMRTPAKSVNYAK